MTFLDPLTKKPHSRLADALVDDTMLGKSDSSDLSYKDLDGFSSLPKLGSVSCPIQEGHST